MAEKSKELQQPKLPETHKQSELIISYLSVRMWLGMLGAAMPIGMILYAHFSDTPMQLTISDFYHTGFGDVFVGILFAIGIFLVTYVGYPLSEADKKSSSFLDKIPEYWVARAAGLFAVGVAVFPVTPSLCNTSDTTQCGQSGITWHWFWGYGHWIHYICAGLFFFCMFLFCRYIFTKGHGTTYMLTDKGDYVRHIEPNLKNRTYLWCARVIVIAIIALAYHKIAREMGWGIADTLDKNHFFFWMEAVGLGAFAVAWFAKGDTLSRVASTVTTLRKNLPTLGIRN